MQLIKIENSTIGNEVKETVNARRLYDFLGVNSRFNDWMTNQIERARLVENMDYVTFTKTLVKGRPTVEYHLTIEAGKSIGMMSATDKGFEIRDYFLDCEKRAKTQLSASPITPVMQLSQAVLLAQSIIEDQKTQITQRDNLISYIQPKAAALDKLALAEGSLCMTDAAKTLNLHPKALIQFLHTNKWIYKRVGASHWVAYQDKLQQMLLEHKTTTVSRTDGGEKITEQVRVTAKGLAKLAVIFGEA